MNRRTMFAGAKAAVVLAGLLLLPPFGAAMQAQKHGHPAPAAAASSSEQSTPTAQVPEKKEEVKDENDAYRHSPAVQKFGAMLGMKPEMAATVFTVVNFAIFAVAVGYGLLKMLPKTFRKRTSTIQKNLVDARTATQEAAARLNSVEARLSKLDAQIAEMRTHAEADAKRDEQRIKASVEDEKVKILAAADAEIQAATALARRQIQQYAAELAIDQAARKLIVTAETDRLLVESFAHRLGSDNGGQN
jgi:F-type H+-transporting ATPase subunit b